MQNGVANSELDRHSKRKHYVVKCLQIWSIFWSVFSCSHTEYGEIRNISPYSYRIRKNTDQKKLSIWTTGS